MRLILVDSENELVRCDFELPVPTNRGELSLSDMSKVAAALVEEHRAEPQHYELRSYRPYEDAGGYFVFVANEGSSPASPTTLTEVMSVCDCIGYVRCAACADAPSGLETQPIGSNPNYAQQESSPLIY
jgi:hypothetical protein